MSSPTATKVAERFIKEAMAVVIRGVPPGYNWGWFSRKDQRMHLQVVDDEHSHLHYKVWLERRGRRIFEPDGKIPNKILRKLKAKVQSERERIENKWTVFMIQQGWLRAELSGRVVVLTAYPGGHNRFTRRIDLGSYYPGAYPGWDTVLPKLDLKSSPGLLAVGPEDNPDDRNHVRLIDELWEGSA